MGKWKSRVTGAATGIKTDELDRFIEQFDRLIEEIPDVKQRIYRQVGEALLKNVRQEIDNRVSDPYGKVKRWQDIQLGSKGGFVKVLPTDKSKDKWGYTGTMKTYALERGHAVPQPTGRWKRYETWFSDKLVYGRSGRGLDGIVPGRMFYSWAKMDSKQIALSIAEEEVQNLMKSLGE